MSALIHAESVRRGRSPVEPLWPVEAEEELAWASLGGSLALLRLRDPPSVLSEPSWLDPLDIFRPLWHRSRIRPRPSHTKPMSQCASLPTTYAHHLNNILKAMQNLIGNIVKVHNHASRHANAPNIKVFSIYGGIRRKFFSRSNLTALDS